MRKLVLLLALMPSALFADLCIAVDPCDSQHNVKAEYTNNYYCFTWYQVTCSGRKINAQEKTIKKLKKRIRKLKQKN